jgi:hypothetical protein
VLQVKGTIFDQIAVINEAFVDNVTELWENATHFLMSVSRCKTMEEGLPVFPNPYYTKTGRSTAFWGAITADHAGDGEYSPMLGFADWFSPILPEWTPKALHIFTTGRGTFFKLKIQRLMFRRFSEDRSPGARFRRSRL